MYKLLDVILYKLLDVILYKLLGVILYKEHKSHWDCNKIKTAKLYSYYNEKNSKEKQGNIFYYQ
jgi:hypothetical protein